MITLRTISGNCHLLKVGRCFKEWLGDRDITDDTNKTLLQMEWMDMPPLRSYRRDRYRSIRKHNAYHILNRHNWGSRSSPSPKIHGRRPPANPKNRKIHGGPTTIDKDIQRKRYHQCHAFWRTLIAVRVGTWWTRWMIYEG